MPACENCQSTDLFQVEVTVESRPARFVHCRRCEHRWWSDPAGTRVLGPRKAVRA